MFQHLLRYVIGDFLHPSAGLDLLLAQVEKCPDGWIFALADLDTGDFLFLRMADGSVCCESSYRKVTLVRIVRFALSREPGRTRLTSPI